MKSGRDIDATHDGHQLPTHGGARTFRSYSSTTTAHDKAQSSNAMTTRAASSCSSCTDNAPMEVDSEPWIARKWLYVFLLVLLHHLRLARLFCSPPLPVARVFSTEPSARLTEEFSNMP